MDFGHLPYKDLFTINFALPPEPTQNSKVLTGNRAEKPKVYIGCPRWGVKEWIGKLYPKGTKDAQFLNEYIKQFNCIELNSTFYNLYNEAAVAKWAERAGESNFRFLPKVFQGISHEGSLNGKAALTHAFQQSIAAFGPHLGPAFLQLSDRFGPGRKKELIEYLKYWPSEAAFFVEVRHPDWFISGELEGLVKLLKMSGKGLIITDTAGRRDCCHMHLSVTKAMVRFVANNLHPTDYTRIDEWVPRLSFWIENGLEELYFIIHMDSEKQSPELAGYLVDKLNSACGLQLKKPALLQQELF